MMIRSLLNTVDAFKENGTDVPESAVEMAVKSMSLDGEAEPPERESDYWEYVAERQDDRALAWQTAVREAAPQLLHGMKFRIEQAKLKDVFMLYPWQLHPNAKVLAITKEPGKRHGRCALVGNSQRLLLTKRGEEIEAHDAVMRLNQAPIEGFDQFVGNKTTYRMINNHRSRSWVDLTTSAVARALVGESCVRGEGTAHSGAYGRKEKKVSLDDTVKSRLTLEENVTLIVSRTDEGQYFRTSKLLEKARPDVMTVLLSRQGVDVVGDILRAFKARVELMRGYPYPGKASPSSGFVGALLLLQLCNEVNVYGVGMGGQTTSWHYWEQRNFGSSREFSLDPHHSFDLEGDAMRALDAGKLLNHVMIKDEEEKTVNELKEFIPTFLKDVKANNKLKWRTAVEEKERQEEEAREAREAEERERQYILGNTTFTAQKFAADSKAAEQAAADAVQQNIRDPFSMNHAAYQSMADSDVDAQKELEEESRQSSALLANDLPDEEIRVGMHK
ncbi:hypothetical protein CYMTET_36289 [Cymbomonas tetramitiformis]|uniref:beta-galactoside alpha-(2,6)-sialyltransferase n=1 Tax=Cymbomonas tetramitiformis TaxID=36881 RepID=A0AAE0F7C8_9CHLO|nr:hypothetical protein CYMTET_36289 [Cymbomonas tetramitiformis]